MLKEKKPNWWNPPRWIVALYRFYLGVIQGISKAGDWNRAKGSTMSILAPFWSEEFLAGYLTVFSGFLILFLTMFLIVKLFNL